MKIQRNALLSLAILAICLQPRPCFSQTGHNLDPEVTLLGYWEVGPCLGGTAENGFVYFGNGSHFEIADVSDPYSPVPTGSVQLPALIYDVDVAHHFAYVADAQCGLQIVDISNPKMPALVGSCEGGYLAGAVTVCGDYAYLADWLEGLRIIDVSDPAHPWEVSRLDPGGSHHDLALRDGLIYMPSGGDGVWIIDVSNPAAPFPVHNFEGHIGRQFRGVKLDGDYAYFAAGLSGLRVYDVTEPTQPLLVDALDISDWAYYLDITEGPDGKPLAVVAGWTTGLRMIDISDPTDLIQVGAFEAWEPYGVSCHDEFCYMPAHGDGMRIIDISDPTAPIEASFCEVGGFASGLVVRDGLAYVMESGMRILDVSDPHEPTPIGHCRMGHRGGVALSGNYAYTSNGKGVGIVDISDPMNPWQVDIYAIDNGTYRITARDSYVLCTTFDNGLAVLDVSNPTSPVLFSQLLKDGLTGIALGTQYAYCISQDDGLLIIDYTTPGVPEIVGSLNLPKVTDIAACGDLAFVGGATPEHDWGLMIVDVSSPTNPELIGFLENTVPFTGLAAIDGYVHLSVYGEGQLQVIDVADPTAPFIAGSFARPGYTTRCVYAVDGLIYANGVWVFRHDNLMAVDSETTLPALSIEQAYPNPFNPTTAITYHLATPAPVRLGIYDAAGRLVCLLKDGGQEQAGRRTVTWRGRDLLGRDVASGTYFIRMETGAHTATRGIAMIR